MKYNLKNFPKFGIVQTDYPSEEYLEHLSIYHARVVEWEKGFEAELREMLKTGKAPNGELICRIHWNIIKEILGE